MQYWINQDGVQAGPMTLDEMKNMALTAEAYVWRSGLDDWVKITQLGELAGVIDLTAAPEPGTVAQGQPIVEGDPIAQAEPAEQPVSPSKLEGVAQSAGDVCTSEDEDEDEDGPEPTAGEAVVDDEPIAQGIPAPTYTYPQPVYPQPAMQQEQQPKCPPTNLVWAILATVLCCIPTGIVAIVYANKVTSRYHAGDYEGAQRASETGAWWCIGSIIAGIIMSPFISMVQMLAAA